MKHRSADSLLDPIQIGKSVRERVGSNDALLHAITPEFLVRIEKLAANVALWGSRMNLTAHPDDPEEIAFHVIDSVMPVIVASDETNPLFGRFARNQRILDLGSGAGFPGLVLASASAADFALVESRRKRASFLQVAVAEMGVRNVTIEAGRAEEVGLEGQYDLVTARAFGDAREFFALATKALKPGGLAMLYASPSQQFGPEVVRIRYQVKRGGERIDRILAIFRQA